MALDLGTQRVGLAISDAKQEVTFIRPEFERDSTLISFLRAMIQDEKIVGLLVGIPRHLSGENSQQTLKVLEEIGTLREALELSIVGMDERFSTKEAQKSSPKRERVDSRAAQILLETYLNQQR